MHSRTLITAGSVAALLAFGGGEAVWAYKTHGKWRSTDLPVPYHINTQGMPFPELVKESAENWTTNKQFDFGYRYVGTTNATRSTSKNTVFMSGRIGSGVDGMTYWSYSGGRINQFDTAMQSRKNWSRRRFLCVCTHELGHALGMLHSQYAAAVMASNGGTGSPTELHSDDVAGARYLYPPTGNRPWDNALGIPELVAPTGTLTSRSTLLRWTPGANAASHEVAVDRVEGEQRTEILRSGPVSGSEFQLQQPLDNGTYHWWVRARDADGKTSEWAAGTFAVEVAEPRPGDPKPVAPIGTIATQRPTFRWEAGAHAQSYDVAIDMVDADGEQSELLRVRDVTATELPMSIDIPAGVRVYWWVRAKNGSGQSTYQQASFQIEIRKKPGVPRLLAPGGTQAERNPILNWTRAEHATHYEVRLDSVDDRQAVQQPKEVQGELLRAKPLEPGKTYMFWVRAFNGSVAGEWSGGKRFRISESAPATGGTSVEASAPRTLHATGVADRVNDTAR